MLAKRLVLADEPLIGKQWTRGGRSWRRERHGGPGGWPARSGEEVPRRVGGAGGHLHGSRGTSRGLTSRRDPLSLEGGGECVLTPISCLRPSSGPDPECSVSVAELDAEHTQKVLEMEHTQQTKLKERQKFFEEAFQQDMEQYLSTGYLQIAERRGKLGRGPLAAGTLPGSPETVSRRAPQVGCGAQSPEVWSGLSPQNPKWLCHAVFVSSLSLPLPAGLGFSWRYLENMEQALFLFFFLKGKNQRNITHNSTAQ